MIKQENLNLKFIRGNPAFEANTEFYNKVFDHWLKTWKEAYMAYWSSEDVFSDQFTRQQYHLVLTYEEQVVGSVAFDLKDLSQASARFDSVFRMWDELSYEKLKKVAKRKNVMVCSWFTLGKRWRKSIDGVDFKKILGSVCIQHFLETKIDVMCATPVHVGGFNKVCYEHFARPITTNAEEKGLSVDFLYWQRKELLEKGLPYNHELLSNLFGKQASHKAS